jgi:hypothetical protein
MNLRSVEFFAVKCGGSHRKDQDAGARADRYKEVEATVSVRQGVRNCPSQDGGGIEDREGVKADCSRETLRGGEDCWQDDQLAEVLSVQVAFCAHLVGKRKA